MDQKKMSKWLKAIIVIAGLCGLAVYILAIPMLGDEIIYEYPEFSGWYWPWSLFLWIAGVPCFIALFCGWKIAASIGRNESFTVANADCLRRIARLAAGDSFFIFAGNMMLLLLSMNHPGIVLCSILAAFAGIAIAITTEALSRLVREAAALQEQSDLTI